MATGRGFEIVQDYGILELNGTRYQKRLLRIRWNGRPSVLDIRSWYLSDGELKPSSKGITLSDQGALNLLQALCAELMGFTIISTGTAADGSLTVEFEEVEHEPREYIAKGEPITDDDIRAEMEAEFEKLMKA